MEESGGFRGTQLCHLGQKMNLGTGEPETQHRSLSEVLKQLSKVLKTNTVTHHQTGIVLQRGRNDLWTVTLL